MQFAVTEASRALASSIVIVPVPVAVSPENVIEDAPRSAPRIPPPSTRIAGLRMDTPLDSRVQK